MGVTPPKAETVEPKVETTEPDKEAAGAGATSMEVDLPVDTVLETAVRRRRKPTSPR